MTLHRLFIVFLFAICSYAAAAQKTLSFTGATAAHPPTDTTEIPNDPLVFTVVEPSLIYYPANPAVRNGLSLVVCPGGGFYYEHIKTEGADVAKWLNTRGVAVFVLQYHLVPCKTDLPLKERDEKRKDTAGFARLVDG